MVLAGLSWLLFLTPAIVNALSSYIKVIGVLAEALLMLWLLVIGVNVPNWREKANRANRVASQRGGREPSRSSRIEQAHRTTTENDPL